MSDQWRIRAIFFLHWSNSFLAGRNGWKPIRSGSIWVDGKNSVTYGTRTIWESGRRTAPEDLLGTERFSPDYDGPIPRRRKKWIQKTKITGFWKHLFQKQYGIWQFQWCLGCQLIWSIILRIHFYRKIKWYTWTSSNFIITAICNILDGNWKFSSRNLLYNMHSTWRKTIICIIYGF